jgi:hypothetical protein
LSPQNVTSACSAVNISSILLMHGEPHKLKSVFIWGSFSIIYCSNTFFWASFLFTYFFWEKIDAWIGCLFFVPSSVNLVALKTLGKNTPHKKKKNHFFWTNFVFRYFCSVFEEFLLFPINDSCNTGKSVFTFYHLPSGFGFCFYCEKFQICRKWQKRSNGYLTPIIESCGC